MKDKSFLVNNNINVDASLELLGDMETYNDIITEFTNNFDEKMGLIKTHYENHDMPNYAIQVHSLKSDARYIGMTELADKAYEHELKSKENDEGFVSSDYDNLVQIANKYNGIAKEYLGLASQAVESQSQAEAPEASILIADDSSIIRSIGEKMLSGKFKVLHAADGEEAIKVTDENVETLHGLLLDLNMPNVDGFQVLEHFKTNNLFGKIPVVIITGDDSKETIMKAFDYPIVDVLAKPFNENDVNRVLTSMSIKRVG